MLPQACLNLALQGLGDPVEELIMARAPGLSLLFLLMAAVGPTACPAWAQKPAGIRLAQPSLDADMANPRLMTGLETRTVASGPLRRVYFVHRPAAAGAGAPLLFVLHGGEGTAPRRAFQTGFNAIADREGFVVVYPQGVDYGWQDGRPADVRKGRTEQGAAVDDVAFFRAMIDDFTRRGEADPKRIYVVGGSNGGMMTQRLACEAADLIAAVVAVVASLPAQIAPACRPGRPLPILMMNGTADPLMPFAGGQVAGNRGAVMPVMETVEFWRRSNGCSDAPERSDMPDRDPADGIKTEIFAWRSCRSGSEVVFFRMNGAGHGLPGRSRNKAAMSEELGGRSSNDFDSSEEAWTFVRRFSLQP